MAYLKSFDDRLSKLYQEPYTEVVNGKAVKYSDVMVHSFLMGDVEDPDIYAAEPIYQWQISEAGQWVMAHAQSEPYWVQRADFHNFGHRYYIFARRAERDQVYWQLKWGNR